jgi:hypothetical protein
MKLATSMLGLCLLVASCKHCGLDHFDGDDEHHHGHHRHDAALPDAGHDAAPPDAGHDAAPPDAGHDAMPADAAVPVPPADVRFGEAVQSRDTDAAHAFLRGEIGAATYLAVVRSASARRRDAKHDDGYLPAWEAGDADGDLVPDDRDRCPGTGPLEPVDEHGCPVAVDPRSAPDDQDVRAALHQLGFVFSPDCAGAPVPHVPGPIKFGYNNVNRLDVAIAATPVDNQPAGCPVYYEFRFVLGEGGMPVDFRDQTMRVVFNARAATESTPQRVVFRVGPRSTGEGLRLFQVNLYHGTHFFQVRAMNGNGQTSGWSALRSSEVSFGEP